MEPCTTTQTTTIIVWQLTSEQYQLETNGRLFMVLDLTTDINHSQKILSSCRRNDVTNLLYICTSEFFKIPTFFIGKEIHGIICNAYFSLTNCRFCFLYTFASNYVSYYLESVELVL